MTRALILSLAVGVTGWTCWAYDEERPGAAKTVAAEDDDPTKLPTKLPDAPLRLKKKNKQPAVDPMPGGRGEKPDVPEIPKLEDDEKLDEMDDVVPPAEREDPQQIMERIIKNARSSEERLASKELGEGTEQLQQDIIDDLDKLIKLQQQNQQNQQQRGSPGQPGGGRQRAQGGRGEQSPRSRLSRQDPQEQMARNDPNQAGNTGGGGSGGPQGDKNGSKDLSKIGPHLPDVERGESKTFARETFMQKYEKLTEKYLERIAEKSRTNK